MARANRVLNLPGRNAPPINARQIVRDDSCSRKTAHNLSPHPVAVATCLRSLLQPGSCKRISHPRRSGLVERQEWSALCAAGTLAVAIASVGIYQAMPLRVLIEAGVEVPGAIGAAFVPTGVGIPHRLRARAAREWRLLVWRIIPPDGGMRADDDGRRITQNSEFSGCGPPRGPQQEASQQQNCQEDQPYHGGQDSPRHGARPATFSIFRNFRRLSWIAIISADFLGGRAKESAG
jgi:hypothetical protein